MAINIPYCFYFLNKIWGLGFCLFCFVCFVCLFVWYLEKGLCLCYEFAFDCYYKHNNQQSLGKWRVYITLQLTIYNKWESGKKNSRQEPESRMWSRSNQGVMFTALLPTDCSFLFHIQPWSLAQKWYWSQLI